MTTVLRGPCRVCGGPVPTRKYLYCGHDCEYEGIKRKKKRRGNVQRMKDKVFRRDRGICSRCGEDCSATRWEADHIIPLADGGAAKDLKNVRTLCPDCHGIVTSLWRAVRPTWNFFLIRGS